MLVCSPFSVAFREALYAVAYQRVERPEVSGSVVFYRCNDGIVFRRRIERRLERAVVRCVVLHELAVLKLIHAALGAHHDVSAYCWVEVEAQHVNVVVAYLVCCNLFKLRPAVAVPHVNFARSVAVGLLRPQAAHAVEASVVDVYAVEVV